MKKTFLFVLTLAVAVPAWSSVIITCSGHGTTATVGYNYDGSGARPRAFALILQAANGTISSITPTKTGQSTAAAPGYGIFPGTINLTDSLNPIWNTPIEPTSLPGGPSSLGTNRVVVALASVYSGDANKPANSGSLFTVVCSSGTTNLSITPETTYRGGVIGEDGNSITVAVTNCNSGCCGFGAVNCFMNKSAQIMNDWCALGCPACWCFPYQCEGDASISTEGISKYRVYQNDLTILVSNWQATMSSFAWNPCADIDHKAEGLAKYRVYQNDLTIMVRNWQKKDSYFPGDCATRVMN